MATKRKAENSETPENTELEVLRSKVRKLEAKLQRQEKSQLVKNETSDQDNHQVDVIDFMSEFMNNHGLKCIADKIFSFLDCHTFVKCRLVCRPWKNYIDNEWSMLQLQIFHLSKYPDLELYCKDGDPLVDGKVINFHPLIEVMKKSKDKSELRVFINLCREYVPLNFLYSPYEYNAFKYLIDHHKHQELKLLLSLPKEVPVYESENDGTITDDFKYACEFGCESCVKVFLDRSEEKQIDLNHTKPGEPENNSYEFEHCLFATLANIEFLNNRRFRKGILDLLLRSAEEKRISIHVKNRQGRTLRDEIILELEEDNYGDGIDTFSEATYEVLNIDSHEYMRK